MLFEKDCLIINKSIGSLTCTKEIVHDCIEHFSNRSSKTIMTRLFYDNL
jgi:hypothetical protein